MARTKQIAGITGYVSVNQLTIEATADLGELGTAAVKFQGGIERGIKSLRFTAPTPMEKPPAGRVATIKQPSKTQPAFTVVDLQVLYLAGKGQFQTSQTLYFKETVKIDLGKIDKLAQNGAGGLDFDVTLGSGQQHTLELIERPKGADGKSVMQMIILAATEGTPIRIEADGDDAQTAVEKLAQLFEDKFGEGE